MTNQIDTDNTKKIIEFDNAMKKYHEIGFYNKSGIFVSTIIISLQIASLFQLLTIFTSLNTLLLIFTFICAYLTTDFVNGLVHLYMDNNTSYTSWTGPFIASFHLHHKTPQYKNRNPFKIYFYESGTKYWLVFYLLILLNCQINFNFNNYINFFFVSVGILSSLAEVSHYWCHNSRKHQKIINALQKYRILLNKKHHSHHHISDNMNYAFLNGVTDPIINKIANYFYDGYKNNSDKHVIAYAGKQSINRE